MGKIDKDLKPFTTDGIQDRDLVIQMLKYEDSLIHGSLAAELYTTDFYRPRVSLDTEHTLNRATLKQFGFDASDDRVANYRKIFSHYYRSPTDYDKQVMNSVTYMRENKLLYYTKPIINIGDIIPDCEELYCVDGDSQAGVSKTTLYKTLGNDFSHAFVAAFSTS